jgi:hypothetical protein
VAIVTVAAAHRRPWESLLNMRGVHEAKLIVFSQLGYAGASYEFGSNDPELVVTGNDLVV